MIEDGSWSGKPTREKLKRTPENSGERSLDWERGRLSTSRETIEKTAEVQLDVFLEKRQQ
jgi:hypothetical protein